MDYNHLEKLKSFLKSDHDIKTYKNSFSPEESSISVRLPIANTYFGKVLAEKYGLISHRSDCSKLIKAIPIEFYKDFIRGIVDADGSLICSFTQEGKIVEK